MNFRACYFAIALVVLMAVGYVQHQRNSVLSKAEIKHYHAAIREAASRVPYFIGDYVGEDVSVPQSAVELLKPNVILSRRYTNSRTGAIVDFLFVHCEDAQDMLGHHPPVCYPAHGWSTVKNQDLSKGNDRFAHYFATKRHRNVLQKIQIKQGLLLFEKPITPDMQLVLQMSTRRAWRALGAGQIQLVFSSDISEESLDPGFEKVIRELAASVTTLDDVQWQAYAG